MEEDTPCLSLALHIHVHLCVSHTQMWKGQSQVGGMSRVTMGGRGKC